MSPAARAGALLGTVVAADQATKALVRRSIERGERESVLPGVEIVNVRNRGVAFGLLSDGGALVAVVAVVAVVGLVAFFLTHRHRPLAWLPTGLLLGGAAGNLIDRVRENAVTDFIDLPLWPAFNLADTSITFGVLALFYVLEAAPRREGGGRYVPEGPPREDEGRYVPEAPRREDGG